MSHELDCVLFYHCAELTGDLKQDIWAFGVTPFTLTVEWTT